MLTSEHVDARVREGALRLAPFDAARRRSALALATAYLEAARAHLGQPRQELLEAWRGVEVAPRDRRIAAGLCKLILDSCGFAEPTGLDPVAVRDTVFALAARARRALPAGRRFDRQAVLAEAATALASTPAAIEEALLADLPGAQRLLRVDVPDPPWLVARYELGRAQAVLLRALEVVAEVTLARPEDTRALFRALKFHRLLFRLEAVPGTDASYRILIDGPLSMFESATRYGLRLALMVPYLTACHRWKLTARVRWQRGAEPVTFSLAGGPPRRSGPDGDGPAAVPLAPANLPVPDRAPAAGLPTADDGDGLSLLLERLAQHPGPWRARASHGLLELPGLGLVVPDLEFEHAQTGQRVFFEQLGYWSRAAVWRRVELVLAGLREPIVFGVPARLRVSEEVLPDALPAALYVYPNRPGARALLERIEAVAARTSAQLA